MDDESRDALRASCLRLLAHDLNNPLTAIRILAEMLHDEVPGEEARRDTRDVLEAADLATALIDGMSSLLRLDGGEEEYTWFALDLVGLLREAVDRPALRHQVVLDLPRALTISGDRRALSLAFTDVLINGRRLVEGGAPLEVTADPLADAVEVRFLHPGLTLTHAACERLLDPYGAVELRRAHRLPVSAVGLGFANHVVRRHGGAVRFERVERGAVAVVRLPVGPVTGS